MPRWKQTLKWQLRFHAYFWPMFLLLYVVYYGIGQIELEHDFPTPTDWGFWARWEGRGGKCVLDRIAERGWAREGEWGRAWEYFGIDGLLGRLEDFKREGKGLRIQEVKSGDGMLMVDGVGKLGFDISSKSDRWKQGYWECLMGLAKIAEHLDGCVKKREKKLTEKTKIYKNENIPSPENPRPVPMPWAADGSHLQVPMLSEVEPALEDPQHFYLRILTSHGFTNRQRLDAALAFADWCDFKGLNETAGNMYDWALDIAAGGLPHNASEAVGHVVDIKTGIIQPGAEKHVTSNLLKATTALGIYHARHGEIKEALPIFLSVLRARKALPPAPSGEKMRASNAANKNLMTAEERANQTSTDVFTRTFRHFLSFFSETDNTRTYSNGDEVPHHTLAEACEEVGIMTYIGEILFASTANVPEREKGLSWTRDSVDAAEAILWFMDESGESRTSEGRTKCRQCLETGLQNWKTMTKQMSRQATRSAQEAHDSKGWLGLGIGQGSAIQKAEQEVKRWNDEEVQIELRRQKTASLVQNLAPDMNAWGMISTIGS